MFVFNQISLFIFSGILWFLTGTYLMVKGLHLILFASKAAVFDPSSFFLFRFFSRFSIGKEEAGVVIICICLFIGYIKGRKFLKKTADRVVDRILAYCSCFSLPKVLGKEYWFWLLLAIGLFLAFKFLGVKEDITGVIALIAGSSLINGSTYYFRSIAMDKAKS